MTRSVIRSRVVRCLVAVLLSAVALSVADAQEKQPKSITGTVQEVPYRHIWCNYSPIGATFVAIDNTLRSQLQIPADRGVVVTRIVKKGPFDKAGLKVDDILLSAGDKPIGKQAEFETIVRESKQKKLKISLIRDGKRQSVDLPIEPMKATLRNYAHTNLAWLTTVHGTGDYFIGVNVVPVGRTLRAHLRLLKGLGVVVTNVVKGSPAMKAGLRKHDVLLTIDDKPIGTLNDLRKAITASSGKPLSIKLVRNGKQQAVQVTPERRRDVTVTRLQHLAELRFTRDVTVTGLQHLAELRQLPAVATPPITPSLPTRDLAGTLDRLNRQLNELQKSVDELRKSLPKKPEKPAGNPGRKN